MTTFARKSYYEVYLVVSNGIEYHWYHQNKGGLWSHKLGETTVSNVDAAGKLIYNPAKANHNYEHANYNSGGIKLWIKRR